MDQESQNKLEEIKKRWAGSMKNVCCNCMYEAIRHFDRNMDPTCNPYEEDVHPGRYDGEIYAYAGGDIKDLIDIIEKLNNITK